MEKPKRKIQEEDPESVGTLEKERPKQANKLGFGINYRKSSWDLSCGLASRSGAWVFGLISAFLTTGYVINVLGVTFMFMMPVCDTPDTAAIVLGIDHTVTHGKQLSPVTRGIRFRSSLCTCTRRAASRSFRFCASLFGGPSLVLPPAKRGATCCWKFEHLGKIFGSGLKKK